MKFLRIMIGIDNIKKIKIEKNVIISKPSERMGRKAIGT